MCRLVEQGERLNVTPSTARCYFLGWQVLSHRHTDDHPHRRGWPPSRSGRSYATGQSSFSTEGSGEAGLGLPGSGISESGDDFLGNYTGVLILGSSAIFSS